MAGANADDDRNNRQIASQSTDSAADVPGKRGNKDARFASSWWSTTVPDPVLSSNVVTNSIGGQWLFANGSTRLFSEFVMEDWIPEEDLYALSYPEM